LDSFKSLGIKKLVTICPACHLMVGQVYPNIIDGWDIVSQDFNRYLVEKISENKLTVKNPIMRKITFHDPCTWKKQDPKIYDGPRKLLELMGATVVEMTPSRQKSNCCGFHAKDESLSNELAHKKLTAAKRLEADYLAVSCLACFQLSKKSAQYQINTIHMIDLALEAIAGQYARRKESEIEKLDAKFNEKLARNPDILNRRVVFKNGQLRSLSV
jgi:Fe-S oxidoreductase